MSGPKRSKHRTVPDRPLVPRWYVAAVLAVLVVSTAATTGVALVRDGAVGWSLRLAALAAGLLLVAACSALARPRRRRPMRTTAAGVGVHRAPAATVWPLLGAWFAALAMAASWVYLAVTDFSALEGHGWILVTVVGALGSAPDLVRLLTGRLHRWQLEIGPESLTYRGYRTDKTWPWSTIRGARVQQRGPAGVLIDVKGAGKDVVVPITAFAVPAEQLVEDIERGRAAARR